MSDTLVLVGCGNMGFAMLKGWIDKKVVSASSVYVVEPTDALRSRAETLGVHVAAGAQELPQGLKPGLIVFAVKPQVMGKVAPDYAKYADTSAYLSVAAGLSIAFFENILGNQAAIIRCMPNTPAAIGEGMLVICPNSHVSDQSHVFVRKLLAANGAVADVEHESQMDAVTGLSGSGPAYVFHMIEALTQAGVDVGLPEKTAALLAMQTVKGAGALAAASDVSPTTLREQVTSPNGTTAAGLAVLMDDKKLEKLICAAVKAATERSIELGKA
ncbi:pyrroline-5-carboxylate reductase [Bartonella sp. LJL80]